MPSPFPGMDPYLEGPEWTGVHTQLSVEIARQLAPQLQPRYVARTNERFVVATPGADDGVAVSAVSLYPDALIADTGAGRAGGAAAAGLATAPALRVGTVMPEAIRHVTVEVRDAANRRLVTAIEVLSPTNKRGDGRREYLRKRGRLLLGAAHLMEIDLLRSGRRLPMRQALPAYPYYVYLSRAECRPLTDVWPAGLRQPLPRVPVPLLPGDADVVLDLQQALSAVYDTFRYELTIDYTSPLPVPLSAEDAAWANERLRNPRAAVAFKPE